VDSFSERLQRVNRGVETFFSKDCKELLEDLKRVYVFVPTDKTPQTIAMICKRKYLLALDQHTAKHFITSTEEELQDAIGKVTEAAQKLHRRILTTTPPYAYLSPKLHKDGEHWRLICGARGKGAAHLTKPLQEVAQVLGFVQDAVIDRANKLFAQDGVMRSMLLTKTGEVIPLVKSWNTLSMKVPPRTCRDFSTMYRVFWSIKYMITLKK